MANKYFSSALPIAAQVSAMGRRYPQLKLQWKAGEARWTGPLEPLSGCDVYRVSIVYRLGKSPKVRVISPELCDRGDGVRIPHRYSDGSLCLHRPAYGEWQSKDLIAETVVPWTVLWLYDYEVWLATGVWHGGGEHPPTKPVRENERA